MIAWASDCASRWLKPAAGHAIDDDLGAATLCRRDDRLPGRHGFDDHAAEGFRAYRGVRQEIDRRQDRRYVIRMTQKADRIMQSKTILKRPQLTPELPTEALDFADDQTQRIGHHIDDQAHRLQEERLAFPGN